MDSRHSPDALIALFHELFAESERTELVRGGTEPLYLPRTTERPLAQVVFAHGFFSSALHEIAHWAIAGRERRERVDYGYWYKPDGRSTMEQLDFEQVEVKPQALEWIFSVAAGTTFHFSADNLGAGGQETSASWREFQCRVAAQARHYLEIGLNPRADRFARGLAARFGTGNAWQDAATYQVPNTTA